MAKKILIVGGGIGGLCAAIGFGRRGQQVDLVELNSKWSVYGTGIIQQSNVVRAMAQLGIADEFIAAGLPYNHVQAYDMQGNLLSDMPAPRLAGEQYPAMLGIARPALQQVLIDAAKQVGTHITLGVTVDRIEQIGDEVRVRFTNGSEGSYDLLVSADGLYSKVRTLVFGEHYAPTYTGQAVWRYNLPRPPEMDCLASQIGPDSNAGVCPISETMMYLYLTSAEPGNPWMPEHKLAELLRQRLQGYGGFIGKLREQIVDPKLVVYRPLETVLVPNPWYRARVVLIGDAAHAATPHLGQGAGMAIEDAVVLAEEVSNAAPIAQSLERFMQRRWPRAKFIWENSVGICQAELAGRKDIDRPGLIRRMFEVTTQPI